MYMVCVCGVCVVCMYMVCVCMCDCVVCMKTRRKEVTFLSFKLVYNKEESIM